MQNQTVLPVISPRLDRREMHLFGRDNCRNRNCGIERNEPCGVLYCQSKQINVSHLFGTVNTHLFNDGLIQNAN